MTFEEVMAQLESLGTEQTRKIYRRHGSGPNLFGVSFANLEKLRKAIRKDHDLARQLWATGNTDAMSLATMVCDPATMTAKDLDGWMRDIQFRVMVSLFARNVAGKSLHSQSRMEAWTKIKDETGAEAGWTTLAVLAMSDPALPDDYFEAYLKYIESNIQKSKNWVRYAMNGALISIGMRNENLRKKAIAASRRIGKVVVDHGETNCKTPDAEPYILKAVAHRRKRKPGC